MPVGSLSEAEIPGSMMAGEVNMLPDLRAGGSQQQPSTEGWGSRRELITRLYYTENLPLKKVQTILKEQHGFYATERMYKTRLKEWKLRKRPEKYGMMTYTTNSPKRKYDGSEMESHILGGRAGSVNTNESKRVKMDGTFMPEFSSSAGTTPSAPDLNGTADVPAKLGTQVITSKSTVRNVSQQDQPTDRTTASGKTLAFSQSEASTRDALPRTSIPLEQHSSRASIRRGEPMSRSKSEASLLGLLHAPTSTIQPSKTSNKAETMDFSVLEGQLDHVASHISCAGVHPSDNLGSSAGVWRRLTQSPQSAAITPDSEMANKNTPPTNSSGSGTPSSDIALRTNQLSKQVPHAQQQNQRGSMYETMSWRWVSRCFHACILNSNGHDRLAQERIDEASDAFHKMVAHPTRDPGLLTTPILLLSILQCHGQTEMAKIFLRNALAVAQSTLGVDAPIVVALAWLEAAASNNLNNCIVDTQKLHHVMQVFEMNDGKDHPFTVATFYMLAFSHIRQKEYDTAELELRELIARSERTLGACHIQTTASLNALARTLSYLGRMDAAEMTWLDALERSKRLLGRDHPQRLETVRRLASHYETTGQTTLAEERYREVVTGRAKTLGLQHAFTVSSIHDLQVFLEEQERLEESAQLQTMLKASSDIDNFLVRFCGAY